jgi:serine protease Do
MSDLPRIVADTPVGKDVSVVVIRKGKEETKTVKLGRLEDGEKQEVAAKTEPPPPEKSVVKRTLGLDLANLNDDLRKRYKIKDTVKGVLITKVDPSSNAAEKRLTPGDVIVEVAQEAVANSEDLQKRIDKLKAGGRRSALFLIANADGEVRFIALNLN